MAAARVRWILRYVLGTVATGVVLIGCVLAWMHIPDDGSGEGLAFILFSLFFCVVGVAVWAGVQGWLGGLVRWILLRWALVGLAAAITFEWVSIADGTLVSRDPIDVAADLVLSGCAVLVLVVPSAVVGGFVGQVVSGRRR